MGSEGGDAVLGGGERKATVADKLANNDSEDGTGEADQVCELRFRREGQDALEPGQPLQQTSPLPLHTLVEVPLEVFSINGADEEKGRRDVCNRCRCSRSPDAHVERIYAEPQVKNHVDRSRNNHPKCWSNYVGASQADGLQERYGLAMRA